MRKATPLRENSSQSGYLSQCLDLLIVHLSTTAPAIMGTHTHTHTHTQTTQTLVTFDLQNLQMQIFKRSDIKKALSKNKYCEHVNKTFTCCSKHPD